MINNDFMMFKFSQWLDDNKFNYSLDEVKGGWIIVFNKPSHQLTKLISSLNIEIDTGKEDPVTHLAVRVPTDIFTKSGDGVVIQARYKAEILNVLYTALRGYVHSQLNEGVV